MRPRKEKGSQLTDSSTRSLSEAGVLSHKANIWHVVTHKRVATHRLRTAGLGYECQVLWTSSGKQRGFILSLCVHYFNCSPGT